MRKIIVAGLIALFSITAHAGDVNAEANTQVKTTSGSTAQNAGVNQDIAFNSPGKQTIKSAPGHALGGFAGSFSSDYCFGTAQAGGSWLGGSIGGGAPVEGESCVILRGYERAQQGAASETRPAIRDALKDASYGMLCEVNPKVKLAMQRSGLCIDETYKQQTGYAVSPVDAQAANNGSYIGNDPIVLERLKK